jgi:hypothetical protein
MPSEREAWRAFFRSRPEVRDLFKRLLESNRLATMDTLDKNEPLTVLAGPAHNGIIGSVQAKCSCGELVWLAPSTQEMMAKRDAATYTIRCPKCWKLEEAK